MFELWMLALVPLAIVAAGFVFGAVAILLGYDPSADYDEVTVDE